MAIERNMYRKMAATKKPLAPTTKKAESLYDEEGNYNPRPLAGYKGGVSRSADKGRAFSSKGELNAYDRQDALKRIAHLHQGFKENPVSRTALTSKDISDPRSPLARVASKGVESQLTKEAAKRAIVAAIGDTEGFKMIGQNLIGPIKEIIGYEGWARKCLRVRPLAQGEQFRLTKDIVNQTTAWVIGQDGQTPMSTIHGNHVQGTEFKVTAFVDIDVTQIYQMQFDGLDRAQDLARQGIEREEDRRFISLIDAASTSVNSLTYFSTLNVSALEDIRYQVEQNRLVVDKFLINRQELSDLVKSAPSSFDPATYREILLSGYVGNILNAQVVTSAGTSQFEVVPPGSVYAIPTPEYLGDMGVRVDLYSEPFNTLNQGKTSKGWALIEVIGMLLPNAKAVAKGSK